LLDVVFERLGAVGFWGVTPHLIPHHALHAQSGTLSQALGIHGPNLGVGGGQDAAVQGFVMALTWLAADTVPGVWLVMSGWSPEYIPEGSGASVGDPECLAIALALIPAAAEAARLPCVRVHTAPRRDSSGPIDLLDLAARLGVGQAPRLQVGTMTYRLDDGHAHGHGPGPAQPGSGRQIVLARGHGVEVELEPAALAQRRRPA
jgi:hypothetical protein